MTIRRQAKYHLFILLTVLILSSLPTSVWAGGCKKAVAAQPTAEERARFRYYFYEAERLFLNEQYAEATDMFRFCYLLNPDDPMVNRFMGDLYSIYHLYHAALRHYEQSYQLDPLNERLPATMLYTYTYVGEYKKALRMCDLIEQKEGYNASTAWSRYRIYRISGDLRKALKTLDEYLRKDPENITFLQARLELLETGIGRDKQLKAAYEQLLSLDENNPTLLNNYAYFLATHKGDLAQAEQMSFRALQAEPRNPVFLDTYAWILYLRGETTLAAMYIRQAVQLLDTIPDDVRKHYQIITGKNL